MEFFISKNGGSFNNYLTIIMIYFFQIEFIKFLDNLSKLIK